MKNIDENYFKENKRNITINDLLYDDEEILWQGKVKKKAYVLEKTAKMAPFAICWLIFDVCFIGAFIAMASFTMILGVLAFMVLHLMPVWIWIGSIIKSNRQANAIRYIITDQRIIQYNSIGCYIESEMKLSDIEKAEVRQSATDKMVGVADVYVSSATGLIMIDDQHDAQFLCKKINDLVLNPDQKEFYHNKYVCDYCGSTIDKKYTKCPCCGASIKL